MDVALTEEEINAKLSKLFEEKVTYVSKLDKLQGTDFNFYFRIVMAEGGGCIII
jgi:hypothetical protein